MIRPILEVVSEDTGLYAIARAAGEPPPTLPFTDELTVLHCGRSARCR